jgi:hypothetical protein
MSLAICLVRARRSYLSAVTPIADKGGCCRIVGFGPKAGIAKWLLKEKDRLAAVSSEIGRFAPATIYFDLVVDFVVVSSLSVFEPVVVLWPGA